MWPLWLEHKTCGHCGWNTRQENKTCDDVTTERQEGEMMQTTVRLAVGSHLKVLSAEVIGSGL